MFIAKLREGQGLTILTSGGEHIGYIKKVPRKGGGFDVGLEFSKDFRFVFDQDTRPPVLKPPDASWDVPHEANNE